MAAGIVSTYTLFSNIPAGQTDYGTVQDIGEPVHQASFTLTLTGGVYCQADILASEDNQNFYPYGSLAVENESPASVTQIFTNMRDRRYFKGALSRISPGGAKATLQMTA